MKYGFMLNKLRVTGTDKRDAEVKFQKGLNVISGPSDTGKTYIFQCINFMLGGNDTPKPIIESEGYERIYLEIKTYDEKFYTLSRKITGGEFLKYECRLDKINPNVTFQVLKPKHNADSSDNISSFLLSLSGFKVGNLLKKNQKKQTRTLSFRDIRRLVLVDENRIITEESSILSEIKTENTAEKSAFKLILTGKDDSGITEVMDPKIRKARLEAKLEMLNSLIEKIYSDLKESNISQIEKDLKEETERFKEALNLISSQIEEKTNKVKSIWREIQKLESRQTTINELLKRFYLLIDQYKADLQRMEFISEGNQYFTQLEYETCPYCQQSIPDHDCYRENRSSVYKNYEGKDITKACQIETNKINLSLKDLEKTINNLQQEKANFEKEIVQKRTIYDEENELLEKKLQPRALKIKSELDMLLEKERQMNKIISKKEQLNELEIKRLGIQGEINAKNTKEVTNGEDSNDLDAVLVKLNQTILNILLAWNFPNLISVQFDKNRYDFLLSNKPRNNFGKGVRAVTYSAFTLGLMEFCKKEDLPHPGFVVLDSPLTTFREKDKAREDISDNMQESFFNNLITINEQVIILENKEPVEQVRGQINYIEFTNTQGKGREGFFIKE